MKRSSPGNSGGKKSDEKVRPKNTVKAALSSPAPHRGRTSPKESDRKHRIREKPEPSEGKSDKGLVVAGLGASAGGLEALVDFFAHVPADSGIAFVVVTHQHPEHLSLLAEILNRDCKIPVTEAVEGVQLQVDHAYVCPAGSQVRVVKGKIQLTKTSDLEPRQLPIDTFLRTLAQDRLERAVCVIFSGNGADGSLGLKAIKGEGGLVIAQDPATAKYTGMPASAIATGLVDYILPAAEMPAQLVAYVRGPYLGHRPAAPAVSGIPDDQLQKILVLLRTRTRYDFSSYKVATIQRRIERRMNVQQIRTPADYIQYLQKTPAELDLLFKELLISVTCFFRDWAAWEKLSTTVVPELLAVLPDSASFRVWVPGCATGEEAYSVAILLRDCIDRLHRRIDVQVFGTDLDLRAIDVARAGKYPEGIAADVPARWLERYFTRQGDHYLINREIRGSVIFAQQNVISDPPFTKLDWISCRNVLIYLNADLQRRLFLLFHYALNPGGLLTLGTSETVGDRGDLFRPIDRTWKFFSRQGTVRPHERIHLPVRPALPDRPPTGPLPAPPPVPVVEREQRISRLVEQVLLSRYSPASVLVDSRGDILHVHGRTGLYLEPASGSLPRLNILEMAREGLATELRTALRQASTSKREVLRENIRVKFNRSEHRLDVAVVRLTEPEPLRGLLLVTLRPVPIRKKGGKAPAATGRTHLVRALQEARDSLRATIEELAISNEELTSANEELQSANEEMQSSNEELDTSREELQSLNEELSTVNAEQSAKVEELARSRDDMQNLLNSTEVATLFLDNELRIRRYTESATKLVHLIPSDIGRPLSDQTSKLKGPRLAEDCREVLKTLIPRQAEVETKDGAWYLMRILPYRTVENAIDGLVITFVNITGVTLAERTGQEAWAYFENVFNTVHEPLLMLDEQLRLVAANKSFYELFRWRPRQVEGELLYEIGCGEWDQAELRRLLEKVVPQQTCVEGFKLEAEFSKIGRRGFLLNARRLEQRAGLPGMILVTLKEVAPS